MHNGLIFLGFKLIGLAMNVFVGHGKVRYGFFPWCANAGLQAPAPFIGTGLGRKRTIRLLPCVCWG